MREGSVRLSRLKAGWNLPEAMQEGDPRVEGHPEQDPLAGAYESGSPIAFAFLQAREETSIR